MELGTILVVAYLALWGIGKLLGGAKRERGVAKLPHASPQGGRDPRQRPRTLEDLLAQMQAAAGQNEADRPQVVAEASDQLPAEFDRPVENFDEGIADFGEQGRQVAARRVEEADARNRSLTDEDHRRFQKRTRSKAVEAKVKVRLDPEYRSRLRAAIIWREVLDKPVSLRGE